jgi:hypothetical protein
MADLNNLRNTYHCNIPAILHSHIEAKGKLRATGKINAFEESMKEIDWDKY